MITISKTYLKCICLILIKEKHEDNKITTFILDIFKVKRNTYCSINYINLLFRCFKEIGHIQISQVGWIVYIDQLCVSVYDKHVTIVQSYHIGSLFLHHLLHFHFVELSLYDHRSVWFFRNLDYKNDHYKNNYYFFPYTIRIHKIRFREWYSSSWSGFVIFFYQKLIILFGDKKT